MSTYGGYIERLSRKVDARLADIEAIYNFDLGAEFEVAMCALLEDILPAKFGVCRGFVITEDGRSAGDDLIIYDKISCPTLRANIGLQYSVKEQIPVDAVYAYIECKHSITDLAVIEKAIFQTKKVKELMLSRRNRTNPGYEKDGPIYNGKARDWPRNYPPIKNQPFCAIFARIYDPRVAVSDQHHTFNPDLLVLGPNRIADTVRHIGPRRNQRLTLLRQQVLGWP